MQNHLTSITFIPPNFFPRRCKWHYPQPAICWDCSTPRWARGRRTSLIMTGSHRGDDIWGSRDWNWGSAVGKAHDKALVVRGMLSTVEKREEFVDKLVSDFNINQEPWEFMTLAFALSCQRAVRERRCPEFVEKVYHKLVSGEYNEDHSSFVSDLGGYLEDAFDAIEFIYEGL